MPQPDDLVDAPRSYNVSLGTVVKGIDALVNTNLADFPAQKKTVAYFGRQQ